MSFDLSPNCSTNSHPLQRFLYIALLILLLHILLVLNSYAEPIDQGKIYTDWFYNQAFDRLYAQFSQDTKPFMSVEILNTLYLHVYSNFGKESEILEEKIERYELNEELWVYKTCHLYPNH